MEGTGAEPPAEAAEDDAAGGDAPVLPSLRSLVIAFLVGAIAVAGWSWDNPLFELDGEEQTVLHRCTQ